MWSRVVVLILFALVRSAWCKVYERCELARELRNFDVPEGEIATWVCIAQHESLMDTAAMNPGSGDHGLFQISQVYWCSPPGYGCNTPCEKFRDDDISDDLQCIRRIFNEHKRISGDGFNAWVVYSLHCKGNNSEYIDGCSEGTTEIPNLTITDENEISNEDEFGDGYEFPALPGQTKVSSKTAKMLPFIKTSIHDFISVGPNRNALESVYSKVSIHDFVALQSNNENEKIFEKPPFLKQSIHHFVPVSTEKNIEKNYLQDFINPAITTTGSQNIQELKKISKQEYTKAKEHFVFNIKSSNKENDAFNDDLSNKNLYKDIPLVINSFKINNKPSFASSIATPKSNFAFDSSTTRTKISSVSKDISEDVTFVFPTSTEPSTTSGTEFRYGLKLGNNKNEVKTNQNSFGFTKNTSETPFASKLLSTSPKISTLFTTTQKPFFRLNSIETETKIPTSTPKYFFRSTTVKRDINNDKNSDHEFQSSTHRAIFYTTKSIVPELTTKRNTFSTAFTFKTPKSTTEKLKAFEFIKAAPNVSSYRENNSINVLSRFGLGKDMITTTIRPSSNKQKFGFITTTTPSSTISTLTRFETKPTSDPIRTGKQLTFAPGTFFGLQTLPPALPARPVRPPGQRPTPPTPMRPINQRPNAPTRPPRPQGPPGGPNRIPPLGVMEEGPVRPVRPGGGPNRRPLSPPMRISEQGFPDRPNRPRPGSNTRPFGGNIPNRARPFGIRSLGSNEMDEFDEKEQGGEMEVKSVTLKGDYAFYRTQYGYKLFKN